MPYRLIDDLRVMETGRSNRKIVLNKIREARQEVQKLAHALAMLEHIVHIQPDTGVVKFEERMDKPILTFDQLWPLTGWILSLYESFYMIGYAANGEGYSRDIALRFSVLITKVNAITKHYDEYWFS